MKSRALLTWLLSFLFWLKIFSVLAQTSLPSNPSSQLRPGLTVEQVITLKGQPYYQTEHYAHKPGEQVWLYTKKQTEKKIEEKNIVDNQTQWLTLYRKTTARTCEVGDIFVQMSKGVVKGVIPVNSNGAYGPCVIETTEEFLPIVAGKPTEVPTQKTINTVLEGTGPKN